MHVCLDLDDWSVVNNRMDLLLKIKERYPGFKVSVFAVPVDEPMNWGPYTMRRYALKKIKQNLDWIQIIPHGLLHNSSSEMQKVKYRKFKEELLPHIRGLFEKDGLPYEKGFKAPHWRWNRHIVRALNEEGWWGAVDPRQPAMLTTNKFYQYSYAINHPFPLEGIVKLHGHVYGTRNDLELCLNNLFRIPQDAEWHFVTDFLEEKI